MLAPHLKLIGYLILAEARTNMRALIRTSLMNLGGTQVPELEALLKRLTVSLKTPRSVILRLWRRLAVLAPHLKLIGYFILAII